jgi:GT2 family glycosyltransferase
VHVKCSDADCQSISVVIPTWNRLGLLKACLEGLRKSTLAADIVVVDNGSIDGTLEWLRTEQPGVCTIANPRNYGFARAVNQGIGATRTEWVALLNNDAIPDPDWLARMLKTGAASGSVGAVASRMMFGAAPRFVSSAGVRLDPSGVASDLYLGEASWPTAAVEVFGASGGACLYRRAMLEDIGLLEEAFFAYFEDVDLAWRAQLRGWKAVLAPDAVVIHAVSATLGDGSARKRYLLARNKWWTLARNYPLDGLRTSLPLVIAYDALSLATSIIRRDISTIRGRIDAIRAWPGIKRQRKAIQSRRTASWHDIRSVMSRPRGALALRAEAGTFARLSAQVDDT